MRFNLINLPTLYIKDIANFILHPYKYCRRKKVNSKLKKYNKYKENNSVVKFDFVNNVNISMYPQGQVPEYLFTRNFENETINMLIKYLRSGMNIIDIGANVGLYSIIAGKIIGTKGKIWAFEPSSDTIEKFKKNVILNKLENIKIEKCALGDEDDQMIELVLEQGFGDGHRYLNKDFKKNKNIQEHEKIKVIKLDTYFKDREKEKIDLVKIDVEGSELHVLKGAHEIIKNNANIVIIFEHAPDTFSRYGYFSKDVMDYLNNLGLKTYFFSKKKNKWIQCEELGNLWATRNPALLPNL
ncbi:MAG: FkbM family methyltransferase [Patescibacteria group bacterium]